MNATRELLTHQMAYNKNKQTATTCLVSIDNVLAPGEDDVSLYVMTVLPTFRLCFVLVSQVWEVASPYIEKYRMEHIPESRPVSPTAFSLESLHKKSNRIPESEDL